MLQCTYVMYLDFSWSILTCICFTLILIQCSRFLLTLSFIVFITIVPILTLCFLKKCSFWIYLTGSSGFRVSWGCFEHQVFKFGNITIKLLFCLYFVFFFFRIKRGKDNCHWYKQEPNVWNWYCVFISWISITNLVIPFPIYIQDRKTDVDLDKVSFFFYSLSQSVLFSNSKVYFV